MSLGIISSIGGAALSYLGARESNQMQQDAANTNTKKDYDFAQNQLQWRVRDGQKAGLHPLAAIGASPMSPTATTVGSENALGHIGEGVRAAGTSMANKQMDELQLEAAQADVQGKKLNNDLLATQLNLIKQPGSKTTGTGFMPGGSQSVPNGRIQEKPLERTTSHKDSNFMEPGAIVGGGFETTPTGLAPIPSGDVKERLEDSPYELRHFWKYGVLPNFGADATKPPKDALPPGAKDWEWSIKNQEWQAISEKGTSPYGQFKRWFKKAW